GARPTASTTRRSRRTARRRTPSATRTRPGSSGCGPCPYASGRSGRVASKRSRPLWGGRIPGGLAPEAWEFLHSLPHDRFLWPYDIEGTMAHVAGLAAAGVLKKSEAAKLTRELKAMTAHPEL